jgi:hypothetical protein
MFSPPSVTNHHLLHARSPKKEGAAAETTDSDAANLGTALTVDHPSAKPRKIMSMVSGVPIVVRKWVNKGLLSTESCF